MSIKRLMELANGSLQPVKLTPEQEAEWVESIRQFNAECAQRHRARVLTTEQLNRKIDYGSLHD